MLRLQHDFTTEWKEKADKVSCSDPPSSYKQMKDGSWKADLFGVEGVAVATRSCLAVMDFTKTLLPLLLEVRYSQGGWASCASLSMTIIL